MKKIPAALRLQGSRLKDRWTVLQADSRTSTQTGACFSVGYFVEDNDGNQAYLKALNFDAALRSADPARSMMAMTDQFNFERDLLEFCRGRKMSRVVRAVDDGIVMLGDDSTDIVQYIIFEPADGDLRKLISTFADIDLAWAITITHQSAVGLMQLHTQNIAHQDLKPSNVLSFAGKANAKIADLGCASRSGFRSPRDTLCIPGARQYAAPELVYGQMDRDWRVRRLAPDLFQLGSLICFLYTGKLMLATMLPHVPLEFRPSGFGGDFRGRYADAQPFIYDSFVKALNEVRPSFSGNISEAMFELMGKLCDPNPATRGAGGPKWSGANQYSLTPFVSRLGILQARAQYAVKTCLRQIDGDYSAG